MAADDTRDGVEFTHLDQPLADEPAITKRNLVDYLDAMSSRLVPVLADRPLSVIRVRPGQAPFMQKNLPKYTPDWVASATYWADRSKRAIKYALCNDARTLLWLANQRAVEFHAALFRTVDDGHATHLVMDIDPPEGAGFDVVVAAARLVRRALADSGLDGAIKTSGAKGVHIFVPIKPSDGEAVAAASRALAVRAERLDPDLATTAFVIDERGGRVFLDSTRAGGATVAAAYSPRLRPGLPVSCPVDWDELDEIDPTVLTIRTVPGRLGAGDLWASAMPEPQSLPADLVAEGRKIPIARVQAMHAGLRRAGERRRSTDAESS